MLFVFSKTKLLFKNLYFFVKNKGYDMLSFMCLFFISTKLSTSFNVFKIDFPIEITTFTDIPGQTGLGSSSAFAVGLVNALHALKGEMVTKHAIASEAAHIEVDLLGRSMGKQDHFASAYGNLNVFTFNPNETVLVEPVLYESSSKKAIEKKINLVSNNIDLIKRKKDLLYNKRRKYGIDMMKINHAGEISAQYLYYGQSYLIKEKYIKLFLLHSGKEEKKHLFWCLHYLSKMKSHKSKLYFIWKK